MENLELQLQEKELKDKQVLSIFSNHYDTVSQVHFLAFLLDPKEKAIRIALTEDKEKNMLWSFQEPDILKRFFL